MNNEHKKIAVLTSGGDAPGLNACIRAIVRYASCHNIRTFGIRNGYDGLIDGELFKLQPEMVSNIIQLGGTILKTSRSERFKNKAARDKAGAFLKLNKIEALIVIGGDGSLKGMELFAAESDIPCIGVPKTIDNDINGIDFSIGFDTAVNNVLDALDKIRDTAESHNRIYFVEVMGRNAGYIAAYSGLAAGAEAVLIPESNCDEQYLYTLLKRGWKRPKSSLIVVVAEGDESGGAQKISEKVKKDFPDYDIKICVPGHIQRGGSPSCADRILATELGAEAVKALLCGKANIMVGKVDKQFVHIPLQEIKKRRMDDPQMLQLIEILSS